MNKIKVGFNVLLVLWACVLQVRAGNVVTINPDHVLVINGQKVFPIGFTLGPPPDGKTPDGKNGLQELADTGGTFLRTGPKGKWDESAFAEEERWESAVAQHGLYCWLYLHDLASVRPGDRRREELLKRVVNHFKDNPGLGLWKSADEPQWGKLKPFSVAHASQIVRQLDTNHPIVVIQAPRGTVKELRDYNDAGDIVGADIYPVSYPPGANSHLANKELSMVGDYTQKMMEVSEGKMPVWMVLQIAWSGVVKPGKTLRFPTFPEERFMTYDAIINGARGLVYFGGNVRQALSPRDADLGWNWTFWNRVLKPVVEEVGAHSPLEPALTAPESKLPIKVVNGPGIEFCVREAGRDIYILACKREGPTVQPTFENIPLPNSVGELMYESPRTVTVTNGKFTDWFGPFEVHVYHFTSVGTETLRKQQ